MHILTLIMTLSILFSGPLSLPSDLQRKTYLHIQILGGKSFIEFEHYQSEAGQQTPSVTLHIHFRGQRFKSRPTPCCVNPNLKQGIDQTIN